MSSQNLAKSCQELPYSNCDALTNEIYDSTINALRELLGQYDYSSVLGELSKIWPHSKAIPFFSKIKSLTPPRSEHSFDSSLSHLTIATQYIRCYSGGIERVQAQLMNLWVEMGHHVICFTEEPENELDFPYPPSVKRIIIPTSESIIERLHTLHESCLAEHVDLYVNHNWGNPSVLWECILLKLLGIPFIQYIHGFFTWSIWGSKENLYQPELFKLCDLVLSLSETNARFYQLCGCNSYMVQNPIPNDLANNTFVSPLDAKHILMVGRLSPEKQPMDCLKIFKLVHDQIPDAVLDIVGDDECNYISQINTFISDNGLEKNIMVHGKKNQAEVANFYKNASCFIFASEMESYSMVILEAKSYGLPIVMYELPYLTLVKDGKGILTANQGDIHTMADHLIRVLSDGSYRRNLGKEARESFNFFNTYDIVGSWQNIISLSVCGSLLYENDAYFNPADVTYADKFIEPMLLDAMKKGYDHIVPPKIDYHVGHMILKYPRKLKALLSKIKKRMISKNNN